MPLYFWKLRKAVVLERKPASSILLPNTATADRTGRARMARERSDCNS